MVLIAVLVALGTVLSWTPVRSLLPSESLAAVVLVAVALVALLSLDAVG